jgi:flagellar basal body-associated protein FliL
MQLSHLYQNLVLSRLKFLCTEQVATELIQAGGITLCSEIHKRINSILKREAVESIYYCTYL